jgi:hypothetical protein
MQAVGTRSETQVGQAPSDGFGRCAVCAGARRHSTAGARLGSIWRISPASPSRRCAPEFSRFGLPDRSGVGPRHRGAGAPRGRAQAPSAERQSGDLIQRPQTLRRRGSNRPRAAPWRAELRPGPTPRTEPCSPSIGGRKSNAIGSDRTSVAVTQESPQASIAALERSVGPISRSTPRRILGPRADDKEPLSKSPRTVKPATGENAAVPG